MKSSGDISCVPLGREICLTVCILSVVSLCSILRDSLGFRCGNSVKVHHSFSSSVLLIKKFLSVLLRWAPHSDFIRNSVRVVGDLVQSWDLILGMSLAPPCLVRKCCIKPL